MFAYGIFDAFQPYYHPLLNVHVQARMGVHECVTHKLIDPFQVLYDRVPNTINLNLTILAFEIISQVFSLGRGLRRSVQVHSIADAQRTP